VHAASMDTNAIGPRRSLSMPGVCVTVGEQIAALERIAGAKAVKLIRHEPDPVITRIVAGWPERFDPVRASKLGFKAESSFDEIVRAHVDDELNGKIA